MSTASDLAQEPGYFTKYQNFALSRSASGVLTLRFYTGGGPHTFDGTTHHNLPRLLEDIAFDQDNRILVLTGTGDSFINSIDGPSLGDITKPMGADVLYVEGRRGVQRLADLEIPIIAAVKHVMTGRNIRLMQLITALPACNEPSAEFKTPEPGKQRTGPALRRRHHRLRSL